MDVIRSKTKRSGDSSAHVFPRFTLAACNIFKLWLVHFLCCLWLAGVVTYFDFMILGALSIQPQILNM